MAVVNTKQVEKSCVRGRPSIYSEEIEQRICLMLMDGYSLRSICNMTDMPAFRTVYYWLSDIKKEDFRKRYMQAKRVQAEILADEIIEIVDSIKVSNDIDRARLQISARKCTAGKLYPKKYL